MMLAGYDVMWAVLKI